MKLDDTRATHKSGLSTSSNAENHRQAKSGNDGGNGPECSLLDYLQIDPRPTFILDVADSQNSEAEFTASHVFSNSALAAWGSSYQDLVTEDDNNAEAQRFRSWLKVSARQEADRHSHHQHRHIWTTILLDSRWLVVSGVKVENDQEHLREVPSSRSHRRGQSKVNSHFVNEPGKRKGEALLLRPQIESTSSDDSSHYIPFSRLPPSDHLTFIRNFDWASTSLGPLDTWSSHLRQACELMLANPDPCTIFWGDDLIMIWNEPYIAVAGGKHPRYFGCSARESWREVWDQYDPLFNQMRIDGKSFKHEDVRLLINRNGFLEEGFFNLRVMPVQSDDGTVIGFYEPVLETTRQVLAGRRLETLLQIGQSISLSTSIDDLWQILLSALQGHEDELCFTALYLPRSALSGANNEDTYMLKGTVGVDGACLPNIVPGNVSQDGHHEFQAAFQRSRDAKSSVILRMADGSLSANLLQHLQNCGLQDSCRSLVISPLKSGTDGSISAMLVIGTSPRREYDDDYALFVQLLVRSIEGTVTFVELFEKERWLLKAQAAHESEARLQTFAERAQVGIFIFDPSGAIKFCNDAWLELCGLSRDQVHVPMSWVDTVHPDNASEIVQYWHKISNLEGPQTFEVQYKKPWQPKNKNPNMSLDRTYVLASAYAEVSESGELTGIMGCVTDISHVKWAERIQLQRLEEALEMKRQQENFLDITSHEMRNPLNAILHCTSELVENLTSLTSDGPVTKPRATILNESLEVASTIQYCGQHQKRIIDDVLTVSKLDSHLLVVAPLSSRPPHIVQQVLSVFETEIRASLIETEVVITDAYRNLAVEAVMIDPHRVIQIIINLFSNAIKFLKNESHRHLKIVIGASMEEPANKEGGIHYVPSGRHLNDPTQEPEWGEGETLFLTFSVQDTGPGMTPEEASSLFHRFIQGSPRTHTQYGGSGLGLFISRELTELHGGRIGLSSQVGLGSTFDFYVKGRRDIQGMTKARRPSTNVTGSSPSASAPEPHAILARLTDSSISPGSPPPLKEVRSSPSVMQVKKNANKLRVLVVEDNLINQQILKKIMRKQGYEVSIANHGEEALTIIEASTWSCATSTNSDIFSNNDKPLTISLILCDVEMPVMDGKTTVRRIREMQRSGRLVKGDIPVIAVTGNARPEQIREALECGFDDVVSKPYEVADLIERIRRFTVGVG